MFKIFIEHKRGDHIINFSPDSKLLNSVGPGNPEKSEKRVSLCSLQELVYALIDYMSNMQYILFVKYFLHLKYIVKKFNL